MPLSSLTFPSDITLITWSTNFDPPPSHFYRPDSPQLVSITHEQTTHHRTSTNANMNTHYLPKAYFTDGCDTYSSLVCLYAKSTTPTYNHHRISPPSSSPPHQGCLFLAQSTSNLTHAFPFTAIPLLSSHSNSS